MVIATLPQPGRVDSETLSLVESLPYGLLARAEVSHDLQGEHASLSLYALDAETFQTIAGLAGDVGLIERDAKIRKHFSVMPRYWIKFAPGQTDALSEYYQLAEPSLTALRLFVRGFGTLDSASLIDSVFGPIMQQPDCHWGLVVKRSDGHASPRLSVRMPTSMLARTLQELVRSGFLDNGHARRLRDTVRDLQAGAACYLSIDPLHHGAVALDIPSPDTNTVETFTGTDLSWLNGSISYLKVRFPNGAAAEPRWTIYRPAVDALPSEDQNAYVRRVQRYYDDMTPVIESTFGATYQAGQLPREDASYEATETTLHLIERTPLPEHTQTVHLLDLGCGLAGPAIDVARAYPNVRITGVNVSPVQVERAKARIREAGLEDRIDVIEADFHALPFGNASFDGAYAFEALAYTDDPAALFNEVARVIRPNGWLYAKELVREDDPLSANALENLAAHDRTYAMRTRTLRAYEQAFSDDAWTPSFIRSIDHQVSTEAYQLKMFDLPDEERPQIFSVQRPQLTLFGMSHFNEHDELPLYFAEMLVTRKSASTAPQRSDA